MLSLLFLIALSCLTAQALPLAAGTLCLGPSVGFAGAYSGPLRVDIMTSTPLPFIQSQFACDKGDSLSQPPIFYCQSKIEFDSSICYEVSVIAVNVNLNETNDSKAVGGVFLNAGAYDACVSDSSITVTTEDTCTWG
eukprot:TRINITY_DN346_c0_g1_i1.p1 TRINITY_DN346_c0_g1~~TRINITY_DN346_c0_g1_i1.p1  ORF type:complete len:137 (-),score=19.20 TRINITY_DN346_c0_g1_i1:408-818(-)